MEECDESNAGLGLRGRVAVITGAGQGIGREFAKAFARVGAIVVIAEINSDRGDAVAREIIEAGGRALSATTDIADPKSVEATVAAILSDFGRIDVLINNAALFSTLTMRPFDQIPIEEWQRVLHVNVTGTFLCARAVVPSMRDAKWGRIINIASAAVTLGRPNYLHYIASKSALIGMTRSMARELGGDGITVNTIMPGATFTEVPRASVTPEQKKHLIAQQCIPRAAASSDIVGSALFLASELSGFYTGQSMTVDGGCTHQ